MVTPDLFTDVCFTFSPPKWHDRFGFVLQRFFPPMQRTTGLPVVPFDIDGENMMDSFK